MDTPAIFVDRPHYSNYVTNIRILLTKLRISPSTDHVSEILHVSSKTTFPKCSLTIANPRYNSSTVRALSLEPDITEVSLQVDKDVLSFKYKNLPVHIKAVKSLTFAKRYYSYGFGPALSLLAKEMGFRLSDTGLYLDVNTKYGGVKALTVSADWYKTLDILGYSSYTYRSTNFSSISAISNFIISGAYFDKVIFLESEVDKSDPLYDDCIDPYSLLLEYISNPQIPSKYNFSVPSDNYPWIQYLHSTNPGIISEISAIVKRESILEILDAKFSNALISEVTGYSGTDLENFINFFKIRVSKSQTDESLAKYLMAFTELGMRKKLLDAKYMYGVYEEDLKLKRKKALQKELAQKKGRAAELKKLRRKAESFYEAKTFQEEKKLFNKSQKSKIKADFLVNTLKSKLGNTSFLRDPDIVREEEYYNTLLSRSYGPLPTIQFYP